MNKSHLTAIKRNKLSRPSRDLLPFLKGKKGLDYGCGYGFDAEYLKFDKYDLHYFPKPPHKKKYEVIICHFVLNTIPTRKEQRYVINKINFYLNRLGVAYISVRNDKERIKGLTSRGTYQTMVKLDLPILKENRDYKIYLFTKSKMDIWTL